MNYDNMERLNSTETIRRRSFIINSRLKDGKPWFQTIQICELLDQRFTDSQIIAQARSLIAPGSRLMAVTEFPEGTPLVELALYAEEKKHPWDLRYVYVDKSLKKKFRS